MGALVPHEADRKAFDRKRRLEHLQSFIAAGVRFERPITNHDTLWVL